MVFTSVLVGHWEKLSPTTHTNLAIFTFLFMLCAFEVVVMKLTTTDANGSGGDGGVGGVPMADADYDDSSEYEEDIYYEELRNNYDQWSRRRLRYRRRQQRLQQEMLQQQLFRQQQLQ